MSNKIKITLVIVLITLTGFLMLITTTSNESVDSTPEGLGIEIDKQANIVDGEKLLNALGSLEAYDYFSEDLFVFANTAYPSYKNNQTELVGFEVKDNLIIDGNVISFDGIFGSSSNSISVKLETLKNNRLKTSITDSVTLLNIDDYLPSNTNRNQFIGSLSISTNTYSIDYDNINDGFIISLYPEDPNEIDRAFDEAEVVLKNGLAIDSLKYETVNIQRPSSLFGF